MTLKHALNIIYFWYGKDNLRFVKGGLYFITNSEPKVIRNTIETAKAILNEPQAYY